MRTSVLALVVWTRGSLLLTHEDVPHLRNRFLCECAERDKK